MLQKIIEDFENCMEYGNTPLRKKAEVYSRSIMIYNHLLKQAEEKYPPTKEFACKEGCDICCSSIRLAIYPTEISIVQHISPFTIDELKEKVNENPLACPYLKDHRCSIYEFRPVKCRGANCYDKEFCENPPLLFSRERAPKWYYSADIAQTIHQAMGEVYKEKARPITKVVEEYNGKCT
jgi:hypothetical protein